MQENSMELAVDSDMTSPFAMSAYVALKHKGLDFSLCKLDLGKRAHREPAFALPSLTARVPMLRHADFCLTESSAIAEYLEEAFPHAPPLFPQDQRARARARQLQAWLRSDLMPIRTERSTDVIFIAPSPKALSARATGCAQQLFSVAEHLLAQGGQGGHLFGAWSIADLDLAVMLKRLVANGDPVPPRLADYVSAQWATDPVQHWLRARSI